MRSQRSRKEGGGGGVTSQGQLFLGRCSPALPRQIVNGIVTRPRASPPVSLGRVVKEYINRLLDVVEHSQTGWRRLAKTYHLLLFTLHDISVTLTLGNTTMVTIIA